MTTYTAKKIVLKDADGSYLIPYTTPYKGGDAITVEGDKISVNREELHCYNKAEVDSMFKEMVTLPIGTEIAVNCTEKYVPNGCLPEDGTEYSKEQFPDLWNNYLGRVEGPRSVWAAPEKVADHIEKIVYGRGLYVALTENTVITSRDNKTWSKGIKVPGMLFVSDIEYLNGKFFVIGISDAYVKGDDKTYYSVITSSTDCVTWTTPAAISKSYCHFDSIDYNNGYYVVTGGYKNTTDTEVYGAYVARSTDGVKWTDLKAVVSGTDVHWYDIAHNDTLFVIVGVRRIYDKKTDTSRYVGVIATSPNGKDWTQRKRDNNNEFEDNILFDKVIFAGGKFRVFASQCTSYWFKFKRKNTFVMSSGDGITWDTTKQLSSRVFEDACYYDGKYSILVQPLEVVNTPGTYNVTVLGTRNFADIFEESILVNGKSGVSMANICVSDAGDVVFASSYGDIYKEASSAIVETKLLQVCSYVEYEQQLDNFGQCAKFGIDIENGKFRVPFKKNGSVTQQALSDTELGKSYLSGVPNIEGLIPGTEEYQMKGADYAAPSGAFYTKGTNVTNGSSANDQFDNDVFGFDASRCSEVYGRSNTVQMEATALRHFIVVANGQINQSMMDWSAWASSLQAKMNADHTNDTRPYVLEISMSGFDGYMLWSNGYCEQWGKIETATNEIDVILPYEYRDTYYSIDLQPVYTDHKDRRGPSLVVEDVNKTFKTTRKFKYGCYEKYSGAYWKTRGFVKL